MKFTVPAGEFAAALDRAARALPRNPQGLIFAGVRLRVRGETLTVTGSDDGASSTTVSIPVTDATDGARVVPPKNLLALLSRSPARTPVTVTAAAVPELTVVSPGSQPYTFRLLEGTYPDTSPPNAQVFDTDLSRLGAALKAVKECAQANSIVQLVSGPHGVRLHATDGRRVARAELPEANFGEYTGLVPLGVLEQLEGASQVALDRRGRVFAAAGGNVKVTAITPVVSFPDVSAVLDDLPPVTATVPTKGTLAALARLASVSDRHPVVVTIAGDEMLLTVEAAEIGRGQERVELVTPITQEITIALNLTYLRDAMAAHTSPHVQWGWSTPVRPLFIASTEPFPVTVAVVPVRLT